MAGTALSNSMSTTGPMTCTTRPRLSFVMPFFPVPDERRPGHSLYLSLLTPAGPRYGYLLRPSRARPRHHLDDLLGDGRLAHLVHVEGEPVDHLPGVAGGGVHGRHARAVLGRRRLQEGPPDLDLRALRRPRAADLLRARLV